MAQWQDELRRLAEERSGALLDAAHGDVPALEDALVEVFTTANPRPRSGSRERPPRRGRRGSETQVELDVDDLDEPFALVEAALARAADRRPPAPLRPTPAPSSDAPLSDAPSSDGAPPPPAPPPNPRTAAPDVAAVEARVRRARNRRAVGGWVATGVAAAAAVGLVVAVAAGTSGAPTEPPDGVRTAEPVAAAPCGTAPGDGADPDATAGTLAVSLTSQTTVLTPDADWVGVVTAGVLEREKARVDLGPLTPWPLLVRDGKVVATATAVGSPLAEGPSFAATSFAACPGAAVEPGTYAVVVDQPVRVGDAEYRVLSNAVPVRVVTARPAGYRPAWLDGSPLACGSTLDEIGARADGATPAQLLLDGTSVDATGLTWEFRNPGANTVTYWGNRELGLIWVLDGVVRSVGHDLSASDGRTKVPGQTTLRLSGRWDTTDYCAPGGDGHSYPHRLPAGRYQVYAYARVTPPSSSAGGAAWFVQTTDPTFVRVGADGAVLGR
ncbi:hypothetical protein ACFT5B_02975 [Luteimicrobium sp. NPDC057192]|uniref:hypothetical protein n=1 Tax=Luteimicrobium sp. NPDC057192 TaxID=3346042 RepID=UPI0036452129